MRQPQQPQGNSSSSSSDSSSSSESSSSPPETMDHDHDLCGQPASDGPLQDFFTGAESGRRTYTPDRRGNARAERLSGSGASGGAQAHMLARRWSKRAGKSAG